MGRGKEVRGSGDRLEKETTSEGKKRSIYGNLVRLRDISSTDTSVRPTRKSILINNETVLFSVYV